MIEIYESLIDGWPVGRVGVGVTPYKSGKPSRIVVRKGQTKAQRRRAIACGRMLLRYYYGIVEHEAKAEVAA
ncbi:MAG TPA: hypothetical protein VKP30_30585 [Polyangiaceae bacterium]|nr:hypothetical protein [Polyangiaceae bacterium]